MNLEAAEIANYDLKQLTVSLNGTDVEKQIHALNEALQLNSILALAAVDALKNSPDRFFVAERLHSFGTIVVGPLEALLQESDNEEVRVLASLVLLSLGSRSGDSILLKAVLTEPTERYASFIVGRLTANNTSELPDLVISRLRRMQLENPDIGRSYASNPGKDFVVSCLLALDKMNVTLPQDLRVYFTSPNMPVEIRSILLPK